MTTTLTSRKAVSILKRLMLLALLISWGGGLYASDWILAAAPFTFTQTGPKSSFQEKTAELFPKMILDQLGTGDMRLPPRSEMLDRKLAELRNERQSLFLQLSAAIKVRDSLFLQETNERRLKKKIADQEKKIREIQDRIDENLKDADRAVIQIENESSGVQEQKLNFFQSVASFFSEKEEKPVKDSVNEAIKIYGEDGAKLLSPDAEIWSTGMASRDFINFMSKEKVNGYLTGTLTFYGNYFSASVQLTLYPGGKSAGSIIEVGNVDDMVSVARNVTQYLRTVVINSSPVKLYFDISPEEAARKAMIKVDGIVESLSGNSLSVTAGIHTINIESPGYETLAVTYTFKDSDSFFVRIPMSERKDGTYSIYLKEPVEGTLFANGKIVGDGMHGGRVSVNGSPVIAQIRTEIPGVEGVDEEGNPVVSKDKAFGTFFYIPEALQKDGAELVVKAKPVDTASLIDGRRKWAYRGYSAFILTLPVTLFIAGNYETAARGYNSGYVDLDTVRGWEYARTGAIVLSVGAAGFFIYELVRYLHAASSVLPESAVEAKPSDMERIRSAVTAYDESKAAEKSPEPEN